jgi:hypothetical protein
VNLQELYQESKRKGIDVLIAAMARSGSTALVCLMHDPEQGRIALSEPTFIHHSPDYRVAIKHIHAPHIRHCLSEANPTHVVVLVRNPIHVGLSLEHGQWKPVEPHMAKAVGTADLLVDLADEPNAVVVRYEDMVSDAAVLEELAARLDWPMKDRIERRFWGEHRMDEYERHAGILTGASVDLRDGQEVSERVRDFVASCDRYTERFGYAEAAIV